MPSTAGGRLPFLQVPCHGGTCAKERVWKGVVSERGGGRARVGWHVHEGEGVR